MKIAIIHSMSGASANMLKHWLEVNDHKASVFKPYEDGRTDFLDFDYVFSLGCSADTKHKARLNKPLPVKQCVDKRLALASFNRSGVKTLEWTTEVDKIPDEWDQVAVRPSAKGRKAEDLSWFLLPGERAAIPRNAQLYTRCFYGESEYRIVVFNGKVTGRYFKKIEKNGDWDMVLQNKRGFSLMDEHCLKAAKGLNIDYAAFDVIAHNKKDFAILEANSGGTLLDETLLEICQFFNDLEFERNK